MTELVCVTCPIGCRLQVEPGALPGGDPAVSGNRCARGAAYAREEFLAPKRVVTATCRIRGNPAPDRWSPRRVPVRTTAAVPRERIPELLDLVSSIEADLPVARGAVLLHDLFGTGIDLVATRSIGAQTVAGPDAGKA